jgi:hypothetical protein
VETASNLSKQAASLGGGMDTQLLGGMYDQGTVRQQVAAQAASGSPSNVALLPGHGAAAPPVLMLLLGFSFTSKIDGGGAQHIRRRNPHLSR